MSESQLPENKDAINENNKTGINENRINNNDDDNSKENTIKNVGTTLMNNKEDINVIFRHCHSSSYILTTTQILLK